MTRGIRISRTTTDIEQELIFQLQFLRRDCSEFDQGFEPAAKRIALTLRVLLHHHGNSKALLQQLGLRQGEFLDTAGPLTPDNHTPEYNLLAIVMSKKPVSFLPLVTAGGDSRSERLVPFHEWWPEPVLKDSKGERFSRSDLVLHVADTDGGAHVDPDLTPAYMALSRENSMGVTFQRAGGTVPIKGMPALHSMRQIAHEVLSTLHKGIPRFSAEAAPVIPPSREALGERAVVVRSVTMGPRQAE